MYRKPYYAKTTARLNEATEGETIEQKIQRIVSNKEPITDGAPSLYTERKDGIRPEYDIRTDKWEVALEGMEIAHKADLKKREEGIKKRKEALDELNNPKKEDGKAEPTQGGQSTD